MCQPAHPPPHTVCLQQRHRSQKSATPPRGFATLKSLPGFWSSATAALLTLIAVVVHKDNLLQEVSWRVINSAVHRPQDNGERFVHKDEDDGDLG